MKGRVGRGYPKQVILKMGKFVTAGLGLGIFSCGRGVGRVSGEMENLLYLAK